MWESSNNNNISENNITNSNNGITLGGLNNRVTGNNIQANVWGMSLYSSNNSIYGNNIIDNDYGIYFYKASNNTICHNNFVDNNEQVWGVDRVNVWDDGYPSGGNYWSDYNPPDIYSGSYQNETGRDGIGDMPYIIDQNNIDNYPLIHPYGYVPSPDNNDDGIVDIGDIALCALAFGSISGDSNWNPIVDCNQDGLIDIFDLVIIGIHFGETL